MARTESYRLYVDLGASQARRRLKGYGFGVRKVEAVDRGRAAIFHTATGEHRRELESLFEGLIHREPEPQPPQSIHSDEQSLTG